MNEWGNQWIGEQFGDLISKPSSPNSTELEAIMNALDEALDTPGLTVAELAGRMGISRRQAYRTIKRLFDMPPGRLIREARYRKARWLMETGRCSTLAQVLQRIGLSTARYFEQEYESRYKITPSQILG